jgi:hypothetical protein
VQVFLPDEVVIQCVREILRILANVEAEQDSIILPASLLEKREERQP